MDISSAQKELQTLLKPIQHPRIGAALGLQEEVGELAKAIMNWEMYGEKNLDALQEECADVFGSLLEVCNAYWIDLDEAYAQKLKKTKEHIDEWKRKYGPRLEALRTRLDREP